MDRAYTHNLVEMKYGGGGEGGRRIISTKISRSKSNHERCAILFRKSPLRESLGESSDIPDISSSRNNPVHHFSRRNSLSPAGIFLFQALTETFSLLDHELARGGGGGGGRVDEHENYRIIRTEGIKRTGNEGRTIGFPEPERSED